MFATACIAYRYWSANCPVFYVAQVKGDGGVDWGYTADVNRAMLLSPYWQRRFRNDCAAVGVSAQFVDRYVQEVAALTPKDREEMIPGLEAALGVKIG